ncbi:MAG TPA: amidase family protein [Gemmatimonadales bacterium]|nr:amidase family protein [Gemmatimonadales bacterium]
MTCAAETARQVRAKEISPVETVERALARVGRLNPALNAIVTLNPRALDEARALERRIAAGEDPGLLAGVPVGIKDVTPVAGLRHTYGSTLYADHVAAEDAVVVARLRAAGAIILGKTNTPEFAAGGNTWNDVFGRTRNPWNLARSAGGSTGGGAAALAAGMIGVAEGTDLGGSLRIPASFCGVLGIRPSIGLVPTWPAGWMWDTLQVSGPMARTAEDLGLALQAMAGPSDRAPLAQRVEGRDFAAAARNGPKRGTRVAWCEDVAGIGVDPGIAAACRSAVGRLAEAGIDVEPVELDLRFARDVFLALRGYWFVTWMHDDLGRTDDFGVNVRNNVRAGLGTAVRDLAAAERGRAEVWDRFRDLFTRFDHLLTPTMAVPPFPVEQNYPETIAGKPMRTYVDWIAPTFVLSLTGLPVASVPCGRDGDGMPVGLQIVGKPFGEEAVLALAASVQAACPIGAPPLEAGGSRA